MANQEHLQRLKQGVQAWNTWHEYAEEYIDLSGAILNGVDFHQTNRIDANLNGTTLTDAWLWETQRTDGPCKG